MLKVRDVTKMGRFVGYKSVRSKYPGGVDTPIPPPITGRENSVFMPNFRKYKKKPLKSHIT